MNYTPLHVHGVHSALDGHAQYEAYAKRAKELGMTALSITEHGNVQGLISFYEACKKYDLKCIGGIEAYQARKTRHDRDEDELAGKARNEFDQRGPHHLTIFAKNKIGFQNLIRLSSEAFLSGYFRKARIDFELLEQFGEGLIIGSGCLSGKVMQHLSAGERDQALETVRRFQQCVGEENVFIEYHDHNIPEEHAIQDDLIWLAEASNRPIFAALDAHYCCKEDSESHDLMLCLNTGSKVYDEDRFAFKPEEFYLKSYDEMLERFDPEWLATTNTIADMVEGYELDFTSHYFPKYQDVPEGSTVWDVFVDKIRKGAQQIYGEELPQEVRDRLNHEVDVINRMGYKEYLLIVADIVQWCRDNGILTGPGRGSAASSLVCYCLGITKVDPLKYDLIFSRFLVDGKLSMPDIDLDCDTRHRDKIIQYLRDKYGQDRVANIITFGQIKAKQALRDATRILGYSFEKGTELTEAVLPPTFGKSHTLRESLDGSAEFKKLYKEDIDARKIIDAALGLEDLVRQEGVHAAGVIITPGPITDYVPVQQKGEGQPVTTQWDGVTIEKMGLLKMDLLGLTNLDVLSDTVNLISETTNEMYDITNIYDIEPNDAITYQEISNGHTVGVFQLASDGLQELAKAIRIENMDHLAALGALYRPGPMGSGMHHMYAKRKNGQQKVALYHPKAKPILENTYGLCVYQEQAMRISQDLAGFSVLESDSLKVAIGKKKEDKLKELRDRFIRGSVENNIPKHIATKIFDDIEHFGGYAFNKCLPGNQKILANNGTISVDEVKVCLDRGEEVILYSFDLERDNIFEDECLEVIDTGVQEVFEIELEDGSTMECTMDHKFLCTEDYQYHTLRDIINYDLDLVTTP